MYDGIGGQEGGEPATPSASKACPCLAWALSQWPRVGMVLAGCTCVVMIEHCLSVTPRVPFADQPGKEIVSGSDGC